MVFTLSPNNGKVMGWFKTPIFVLSLFFLICYNVLMMFLSLYRASRKNPSVTLYPDFASGYKALAREKFFPGNELLEYFQEIESKRN